MERLTPTGVSRGTMARAAVCVVLLAGLLPMTALEEGKNDFSKAYYPDARSIVETGTFEYSYGGVKNIPLVVGLLRPFALFGAWPSEIAFVAVNQLAYVFSFVLAVVAFARSARDLWVLVFLFVCSTHIWECVRQGQMTQVAFLLIMLGLVSYTWRQSALAGCALAWAFLIKIPAGLVAALFLRRGDRAGIVGAAGTVVVALALSLLFFGADLHRDYWTNVIAVNAGTTLLAANNQNLFALATRYLHEPAFFDWTTVRIPRGLYNVLVFVVVAWVAFLFMRVMAGRSGSERDLRRDGALLVGTALVVFPVSWDHYYVFTVLPLYCVYEHLIEGGRPWEWLLAGLAFVAINLPEGVRVSPLWQPTSVQLTVVSAPVLGCVLLLALLVRSGLVVRGRRMLETNHGRRHSTGRAHST